MEVEEESEFKQFLCIWAHTYEEIKSWETGMFVAELSKVGS